MTRAVGPGWTEASVLALGAGCHAAFVMEGLDDLGLTAMMSTSAFDARNADDLDAWLRAYGIPPDAPRASVRQVHGASVVRAGDVRANEPEADGLWAPDGGILLVVRVADCAPVWLADERSSRCALLHAGWRGLAAGIVAHAVTALVDAGAGASDLRMGIGPHLQPCCCEVGPEVARAFSAWPQAVLPGTTLRTRSRPDGVALDLAAAAIAQARAAGVGAAKITASDLCTRCRPDVFHSYRRNGAGGPLMAAIALRGRRPA